VFFGRKFALPNEFISRAERFKTHVAIEMRVPSENEQIALTNQEANSKTI